MKLALVAWFLFAASSLAAPVLIQPADISLDVPDEWKVVHQDAYPNAPLNTCFPRLDKGTARIDSVLWEPADALAHALDQYLHRLPRLLDEKESYRELSRAPFETKSGIKGIKYEFQIIRQTSCGPRSYDFLRYIFRNDQGQIVCLGGCGSSADLQEIDQIVMASLKFE